MAPIRCIFTEEKTKKQIEDLEERMRKEMKDLREEMKQGFQDGTMKAISSANTRPHAR
jgi:hypothetical protein